jgi:hypothetical protein
MSYIIYSVYDSTDAAELASIRLKRSIKNINVVGISKRVMDDNSEETLLFTLPAYGALGNSMNLGSNYAAEPYSFFIPETNDSSSETSSRKDVSLRVEAPDVKTCSLVSSILRSTGGREIHQAKK